MLANWTNCEIVHVRQLLPVTSFACFRPDRFVVDRPALGRNGRKSGRAYLSHSFSRKAQGACGGNPGQSRGRPTCCVCFGELHRSSKLDVPCSGATPRDDGGGGEQCLKRVLLRIGPWDLRASSPRGGGGQNQRAAQNLRRRGLANRLSSAAALGCARLDLGSEASLTAEVHHRVEHPSPKLWPVNRTPDVTPASTQGLRAFRTRPRTGQTYRTWPTSPQTRPTSPVGVARDLANFAAGITPEVA